MATRTLPEQIADRIVEGMGWQGRVRLGGGALSEQVRIINDAKHRWVGVTASFTAPSVCTIALGTINADGTFVTPLLHPGPVEAEDANALVDAVLQLWDRLHTGDGEGRLAPALGVRGLGKGRRRSTGVLCGRGCHSRPGRPGRSSPVL